MRGCTIQARIVESLVAIGIDCPAEAHCGISDNFSFATVPDSRIRSSIAEVEAGGCDAVAIICTNVRGSAAAARLEMQLGIPVLDSVAVTLWKCLELIGAPLTPLSGWGASSLTTLAGEGSRATSKGPSALRRERSSVPLGWAATSSRGHEVSGHSYRWERLAYLSEDEERAVIAKAVEAIRRATGTAPFGWHTSLSSSENTRRLLVEHGGFEYDSDAYKDDLPWMADLGPAAMSSCHTPSTRTTCASPGKADWSSGAIYVYCRDAFDWLWTEGEHAIKMVSVGLHLRIIGRPRPDWRPAQLPSITSLRKTVIGSHLAHKLLVIGEGCVRERTIPSFLRRAGEDGLELRLRHTWPHVSAYRHGAPPRQPIFAPQKDVWLAAK